MVLLLYWPIPILLSEQREDEQSPSYPTQLWKEEKCITSKLCKWETLKKEKKYNQSLMVASQEEKEPFKELKDTPRH